MSREYYLWCLVDRYLSMDNVSYIEAIEYARRDVYDIPNDGEDLEVLAKHCALCVDNQGDIVKESTRRKMG